MAQKEDVFPPLTALLRQGLPSALNAAAKTFIDMMHENIVFEFPYALPDGVQVLQG